MRTMQKAFNGGVLTPEFFGQVEDAKYQTGLAECLNFIVLPHGPVANRAGTSFVRAVKDSSVAVRLIPFQFSPTQTFAIEMGPGYFRFHTQGGTVLKDGVPYEVVNSYAEADLFEIKYVQSNDVITLVHPNYPPSEFRRYGNTDWRFTEISFAPTQNPPSTVKAANVGGGSGTDYYYKVTTIGSDNYGESLASEAASCNNNILQTGKSNTITWSAVDGAKRYSVYKRDNGLYGYIGQTDGITFTDDNITADLSQTPPENNDPFTTKGKITAVSVNAGGSGYGTKITGGVIESVSVTSEGNYYANPHVSISDPTGSGASLSADTEDGKITAVNVISGGTGYTAPTFVISDSSGSGCELEASISAATYVTPTLTVTDPTGSGATLTPVVTDGAITSVVVADSGKNYTAPVVSINEAGGGSGPTFGTPTFSGSGDYPAAVSYFEQRRCFAGTTNKPAVFWMTRTGTESNMCSSIPSRDDDMISFRLAAREANNIRHIAPLGDPILLSDAAEWRVTSINSDAITPSTTSVRAQSYIGASQAQPVIVNTNLIFAAERGGHVREMAYSWQGNGYMSGDLSMRAPHLFDQYQIVDMAYSKSPYPIVWFVRSDGALLGLTYVPDQQVGAWHLHQTDGNFESVCVVSEDNDDVAYFVVKRTINGESVRYIERMGGRYFNTQPEAYFVDSGLSYSGDAVTDISGLDHLEGKAVNILADGAVAPAQTVTSGSITLPAEASVVHVGLPIEAEIKTLPLALGIEGYGQGRTKNVSTVFLRVHASAGVWAGPSSDRLTLYKPRSTEAYGVAPALKTSELSITVPPAWTDSGQIVVRQTDPLPMSILSLSLEVAIGG